MQFVAILVALALVALAGVPGRAAATGDVNESLCPAATEASPGFRPSLPDCRAFELVTPPFKNGQPPVTDASAVSDEGGGRITLSSIGAFSEPGDDSTVESGEYVLDRGGSGWVARAVNPPASIFQEGSPITSGGVSTETLDYSANLSTTLFLKPLLEAKPVDSHFYLHEVGGSFAPGPGSPEVGPLLAPETIAAWTPQIAEHDGAPLTSYIGASEDLTHVLFSQHHPSGSLLSFLWPGDETFEGSPGPEALYEYAGTGEAEPELVAVENKGSLADEAKSKGKAHINEAAELITQCGAVLGGIVTPENPAAGDTYNAISSDGEKVFFTAESGGCHSESNPEPGEGPPVDELDARINGSETVDISEPSKADCEACDETEMKVGTFQGASVDGDLVYFLSEQALFGGTNKEEGATLYCFNFDAPAGHKVSEVATRLAPLVYGEGEEEREEPGGVVRVADSGELVYLVSEAKLAENQSANGEQAEEGHGPSERHRNLYSYDEQTGTMAFIAQMNREDQQEWKAIDTRPVETTPDGRFLLFSSVKDFETGEVGRRQLYRYEAPTPEHANGVLERISIGSSGQYVCAATKAVEEGYNCDGRGSTPAYEAFDPTYERRSEPIYTGQHLARSAPVAMSSDGSEVFFESPVALTPTAQNEGCVHESESGGCTTAAENVYEWRNGHVYSLVGGQNAALLFGSSSTQLIGADPTGTNVFLLTATSLVAQDTDSQVDVYDARVGGGFPGIPALPACATSCARGYEAPLFVAPASAGVSGDGNVLHEATAHTSNPPKTRAQKLAAALKRCRSSARRKRRQCEASARKQYGPRKPSKHRARKAEASR